MQRLDLRCGHEMPGDIIGRVGGKGAARWEWRSRRRVRQAGGKDSTITNRTPNSEGCGTLGKTPDQRPCLSQAGRRTRSRNTILDGTDANGDGVMAGQRVENRGVRRTAFQLCFYLRDLIGAPGFN